MSKWRKVNTGWYMRGDGAWVDYRQRGLGSKAGWYAYLPRRRDLTGPFRTMHEAKAALEKPKTKVRYVRGPAPSALGH